MSFIQKPADVRRSFSGVGPRTYHVPRVNPAKIPRAHRTNYWPGNKLDYDFLERCKEFICRIPHPTGYYKYKKAEYRLSIIHWSQGAYVDVRMYLNGGPTSMGILLHLDVIKEMLPDLVAAVRQLDNEDMREPNKKAKIEVIRD